MYSHLYCKSVGSTEYRFFYCIIPKDLKNRFNFRTKFYISINSVRKKNAVEICRHLKMTADEVFAEIRMGMKIYRLRILKKYFEWRYANRFCGRIMWILARVSKRKRAVLHIFQIKRYLCLKNLRKKRNTTKT